jgi:hypothetical protein
MKPARLLLITASILFVSVALSAEKDAKTLNDHVTVTTSETGRTVAVLGKKTATSQEAEFLFCLDLAEPQKIAFNGPARVIYRPQAPTTGIPAGVKVSGPESVSSTLAVVPNEGKSWVFVAKGEKAPLPADDPAMASANTVKVGLVRRLDWAGDSGPRRGTELEGCLSPGG